MQAISRFIWYSIAIIVREFILIVLIMSLYKAIKERIQREKSKKKSKEELEKEIKMKETRFILGEKQADNSIIYVKGMFEEEVERVYSYYEAQDYKSLAYARTKRNIYMKV